MNSLQKFASNLRAEIIKKEDEMIRVWIELKSKSNGIEITDLDYVIRNNILAVNNGDACDMYYVEHFPDGELSDSTYLFTIEKEQKLSNTTIKFYTK